MTLILAAAVPPTIQIVLPPGSASPLLTPPPPPTTAATEAERQNIIKYCKKNILPDPAANCFAKVDKKAPTRVLAAAIYCTLERKYFDDKSPRAQVAMMFQVTTAQLTKAVTGVDYMSGPHTYIKKRKTSAEPSTSTAAQTPKPTATWQLRKQKTPCHRVRVLLIYHRCNKRVLILSTSNFRFKTI